MTDLQAAVGLVQLDRLDGVVARRRAIAAGYAKAIDETAGAAAGRRPAMGDHAISSPAGSRSDRTTAGTATELLDRLADADISARRGIMAAHRQPAYDGRDTGTLPCRTPST